MKQFPFVVDIDKINSLLICALALSIIVSVSATSVILGLMGVLFLFENSYRQRWRKISSNPLTWIVFGYVSLHFLGILWSDDRIIAGDVLKQTWKLLLLPFVMMYIKKEHIKYYLQAFLIGMMISEVLTYLVWFDILEPFKKATHEMPSPLMLHTYYTPFVAMASALLLFFLLYAEHTQWWQKLLTLTFLFTMLVNLFITGGRGGQVGFFILFFLITLFYFKEKLLKGMFFFILSSIIMVSLAYQFIPLFKERADKGIYEVTHFEPGLQKTSLGIRMALNRNNFEIFKSHPWFGVGTGDYLSEYAKINSQSIYQTHITHPHNMYLLILVQFGLLGGIFLISIFIYQIYFGLKIKDDLQVFRLAFPCFFLGIMTINWYLYSHHTTYLFIFFSAIFYSQFDKKVILFKK